MRLVDLFYYVYSLEIIIITTTTTFITYNTSYSEKFVHPNLARLIELGGAKIKYLINLFTMTKIMKGNYYLKQERLNVSMIKM